MTIEKIINRLAYLMRKEHAKNAMLSDGFPLDDETLENERTLGEAIALLKTHPDAKSNEPLTLEELRKMEGDIVYCVPLNDWAKVTNYGLLFFGDSEYRGWIEIIGSYKNEWVAYRRPPKED